MITFGSKKEDLTKATDIGLLNSILTTDGCGRKLKKECLLTLLRRKFNYDIIKLIEKIEDLNE